MIQDSPDLVNLQRYHTTYLQVLHISRNVPTVLLYVDAPKLTFSPTRTILTAHMRNDEAALFLFLFHPLLTFLPSKCGSTGSRATIHLPGRLHRRRTDHILRRRVGRVILLLALPYGPVTHHEAHPYTWG